MDELELKESIKNLLLAAELIIASKEETELYNKGLAIIDSERTKHEKYTRGE